eukprot:SAG22_NODE_36_length_27184_cov_65.870076_4_plen_156_part_00
MYIYTPNGTYTNGTYVITTPPSAGAPGSPSLRFRPPAEDSLLGVRKTAAKLAVQAEAAEHEDDAEAAIARARAEQHAASQSCSNTQQVKASHNESTHGRPHASWMQLPVEVGDDRVALVVGWPPIILVSSPGAQRGPTVVARAAGGGGGGRGAAE